MGAMPFEIMMTFRNRRLRDHTLPMSAAWLLNDIAESRGEQGFGNKGINH
jgi:hypothetical protein